VRWRKVVLRWGIEVFGVEEHVGEALIDVDLDALWCMLDGCLGESAVIGAGARAAHQNQN
jgi:hypothetical protein